MSFFYLEEPSPKNSLGLGINLLRHFPEKSLVSFPNHNHEIFEIIYIINGSFKVVLEKKDYHMNKGDILIVNPFQLHYGEYPTLDNNNEHLALTLNLRKWFPNPYAASKSEPILKCLEGFTNFIPSQNENSQIIADILLHMEELFNNMDTLNYFLLNIEINKLFYTLFDNFYVRFDDATPIEHDYDFTKSIAQYLKTSYAEDISYNVLSNSLHMSRSVFYTEFKENFGMSFTNYLGFYRVSKAVEIYKETPMPLTKLASLVGFSDYNYFSRIFKKHMKESPAHYFNKWNTSK